MRHLRLFSLILYLAAGIGASAQTALLKRFEPVCDSLSVRCQERTGVRVRLELSKVMKRGDKLDFYFTRTLGDQPWRKGDAAWLHRQLEALFPEDLPGWKVGEIYCRSLPLEELQTARPGHDGHPAATPYKVSDPRPAQAFIREVGAPDFKKGLSGRIIALWHSHGRYYDSGEKRWNWQRAPLHGTVEDLYTQNYVLPFLIPMLERAGAYILNPRERDTQVHEVVCDNDPAWKRGPDTDPHVRRQGSYKESGSWSDAGAGFADARERYVQEENPFRMGTARKAPCISRKGGRRSEIRWTPDIPEQGRYAVYISYKSLPESTTAARYKVTHQGGTTEFLVDQRKGGGTWIYLGTFSFAKGTGGYVSLDNVAASASRGSVVTADAVRFGGGMGKVARGPAFADTAGYELSGLPAYCEGARYAMQWAGVDATLYEKWSGDYTQDYAARGAWVQMMQEEKGLRADLSLAFHSDAGVTPGDSLVGTLAIYSLRAEGSRKYADGSDRMAGRLLADFVQSQVCSDIRAAYDSSWMRRELWDRSYSESRTTGVPGMILEILSHQNFADMRYGLDPQFRFTVCRAVYKGLLKFLSSRYGCPYAVQPLPVQAFSARLSADGRSARLRWQPTPDPEEPTAKAAYYLVYTRLDDGAFGPGRKVQGTEYECPVEPGRLYSFRVEAVGEGGRSFPSETLCAGTGGEGPQVLVVNNFTRVSGPAWFDTPSLAGFRHDLDAGVAWGDELGYIGASYEFRRDLEFSTNYAPGFGACDTWQAGQKVAGNHFDYPAVHARALMALGCRVSSESRDAFTARESPAEAALVDLICGKQLSTPVGPGIGAPRFRVFPQELRSQLSRYTGAGGSLLLSGANIATDAWDELYPLGDDDIYREAAQAFITGTLGYRYMTGRGSREGSVLSPSGVRLPFWNSPNETCYGIEHPDGIRPAERSGRIALRYADSGIPAAVFHKGDGYRVAAYGFPLECLKEGSALQELLHEALAFLIPETSTQNQ